MLNLLTDPIFCADLKGDRKDLSLPETYAALVADRVDYFPALRPFQRHPWHAFLCQTGALALINAGRTKAPARASEWRALLSALTPQYPDAEPWSLIAPHDSPAFLQPPASNIADYKQTAISPEDIDIVVNSKHLKHKIGIGANSRPEDWAYALISLQTQEGFGGAGNYGVYRMNGGLGSRPGVGLSPSLRPGPAAKRDIEALAALCKDAKPSGAHNKKLIPLLWTIAWNGSKEDTIDGLNTLHPLCVEICRRVRLQSTDNGIKALKATSKAPRVNAKELTGDTGDPWTPVDINTGKSLTITARGFSRQRIAGVLTADPLRPPPMAIPTPAELAGGNLYLIARATARGQGRTEGYHERITPIGMRARAALAHPDSPDMTALRDLFAERAESADIARRITAHAIYLYASKDGSTSSQTADPRASRHLTAFGDKLDDLFVQSALAEFEEPNADVQSQLRIDYHERLAALARQTLAQAQSALSTPANLAYKAKIASTDALELRLKRELLQTDDEDAPPVYPEPTIWARGALSHAHSLSILNLTHSLTLTRLTRAQPGSVLIKRQLDEKPLTQDLTPQEERLWGFIIRGLALTTPRQSHPPEDARVAHDHHTPLGRALYQGGDPNPGGAYISETALSRLLTSPNDSFHTELMRDIQKLSRKNARFDWAETANLIAAAPGAEREEALTKVARDYYRAKNYSQSNR